MAAPDTEQQLLAELSALRAAGQHQCDPVGFVYMTQLAKRLPTQPDPVRRLLAEKLGRAMLRYRDKLRQPPAAAQIQNNSSTPTEPSKIANSVTNLAELNRYIDNSVVMIRDNGWTAIEPDFSGMKSVDQFKQAWSRIMAEDQVAQAMLQAPKNPGPINSHMLVLQTLTLMRQLSPAYLQRFLAQADALLCLDRVTVKPSVAVNKVRNRSRSKK